MCGSRAELTLDRLVVRQGLVVRPAHCCRRYLGALEEHREPGLLSPTLRGARAAFPTPPAGESGIHQLSHGRRLPSGSDRQSPRLVQVDVIAYGDMNRQQKEALTQIP